MSEQEYTDRETRVCETVYDRLRTDVEVSAETHDLCPDGMIHCIWTAMLVEMFYAGWSLEDVLGEVLNHYSYAKDGPPLVGMETAGSA